MRHGLSCCIVVLWGPLTAGFALADEPPIDVPIHQIGKQFRLIGELHWPIDQIIIVRGVVVEGPFKGHEGGPNLQPQVIQGVATQERIQIRLVGGGTDRLEIGQTYEFEGYEQIEYLGMHPELADRGPSAQSASRHLRNDFVVINSKPIEPISLHPGQFEERDSLFPGVATSSDGKSLMVGDGWAVVVSDDEPWREEIVGKRVETFGQYKRLGTTRTGRDIYELTSGTWRLVELADQIGQVVELRGYPLQKTNDWLFVYRGTPILLEGISESPGWDGDLYGVPMAIRGELEFLSTPRIVSGGLLRVSYVIHEPSWQAVGLTLASDDIPIDYKKWRPPRQSGQRPDGAAR